MFGERLAGKSPREMTRVRLDGSRPARLFCTGAGAPPPARTDADASPRRCLAAAKHGRRRSCRVRSKKQEFECAFEPPGPCRFVMTAAVIFDISEPWLAVGPALAAIRTCVGFARSPRSTVPPESLFHQEPSKAAHVAQRRGPFERPDVKVHPTARRSRLFDEVEHGELAEPDRWAH